MKKLLVCIILSFLCIGCNKTSDVVTPPDDIKAHINNEYEYRFTVFDSWILESVDEYVYEGESKFLDSISGQVMLFTITADTAFIDDIAPRTKRIIAVNLDLKTTEVVVEYDEDIYVNSVSVIDGVYYTLSHVPRLDNQETQYYNGVAESIHNGRRKTIEMFTFISHIKMPEYRATADKTVSFVEEHIESQSDGFRWCFRVNTYSNDAAPASMDLKCQSSQNYDVVFDSTAVEIIPTWSFFNAHEMFQFIGVHAEPITSTEWALSATVYNYQGQDISFKNVLQVIPLNSYVAVFREEVDAQTKYISNTVSLYDKAGNIASKHHIGRTNWIYNANPKSSIVIVSKNGFMELNYLLDMRNSKLEVFEVSGIPDNGTARILPYGDSFVISMNIENHQEFGFLQKIKK